MPVVRKLESREIPHFPALVAQSAKEALLVGCDVVFLLKSSLVHIWYWYAIDNTRLRRMNGHPNNTAEQKKQRYGFHVHSCANYIAAAARRIAAT